MIGGTVPGRTSRIPVGVGISDSTGRFRVKLGDFPGTEMLEVQGGAGPRPMGRWLRIALTAERAWIAPDVNTDIYGFALSGDLTTVIRTPSFEHTVTAADVTFYRQLMVDSARSARAKEAMGGLFDSADPPKTLPMALQLVGDLRNNLWLRPYPSAAERNPDWMVFSPDGVWLGRVMLPAGLHVYEIGEDYVLGVVDDDERGHSIRVHRLTR